jgi:MoaA/NifB/PqqE/SkfB family radical SAM enzyme
MSLVTFKQLASKFPPTVCQIAFGIGSVDANPDLIPIMEYCREIGIIPNITINGMRLTRKMMKDLVRVCGAISVSVYEHTKIQAYQAVNWLQAHRHPQINIHLLYYKENERFVREVLYDVKGRVINPRAVVLLALKQKGRAVDYGLTPMPYESFAQLIDDCFRDGIPIGFDSCTGPNFLHWLGESDLSEDRKLRIEEMVLPCESGCESAYIDVFGKFSPCSFIAGTEGWEEGLDVLNCKNFLHDIWLHPQTVEWRNNLLANGRKCPIYDI